MTDDPKRKNRNTTYGVLSCLFLAADMVIWVNSWVYPPLAMPYDSDGEQTTIFTYLFSISSLLQTILSCEILIPKLKKKRH